MNGLELSEKKSPKKPCPCPSRRGAQAFPKSRRILKKLDFKRVFDKGVKVVCPELVVLALPAVGERARLGLVVSRKVGKAIVRNRVKRRLREAFRSFPHGLAWDFVVIARGRAADLDYQDLAGAFAQCYSRLQKNSRLQQKREHAPLASE